MMIKSFICAASVAIFLHFSASISASEQKKKWRTENMDHLAIPETHRIRANVSGVDHSLYALVNGRNWFGTHVPVVHDVENVVGDNMSFRFDLYNHNCAGWNIGLQLTLVENGIPNSIPYALADFNASSWIDVCHGKRWSDTYVFNGASGYYHYHSYDIIQLFDDGTSGDYLDYYVQDGAPGTWPENGGDNQDWLFVKGGSSYSDYGYYRLCSRRHLHCMQRSGENVVMSKQRRTRDCSGDNCHWRFISNSSNTDISSWYMVIVPHGGVDGDRNASSCVASPRNKRGHLTIVSPCDNTDSVNVVWRIKSNRSAMTP